MNPRRKMPRSFPKNAHLPQAELRKKSRTGTAQIHRWRAELGVLPERKGTKLPVAQYAGDRLIATYPSSCAAAKTIFKASSTNIMRAAGSPGKTAYGFTWKFIEQGEE